MRVGSWAKRYGGSHGGIRCVDAAGRSQPGARTGPGDRGRGAGRLALDRPRRQEQRRRRRRGRHAQGLRHRRHQRHRGDRRGRDGRGADALYRREDRPRRARRSTSPSTRWRAPRSPPRAGRTPSPPWPWPSAAASCTRPTSTWTRSRSAPACRRASSISTPGRRRTCASWRAAKKCDIGDLMVCTLDRDRHSEMIEACRAAGARIMLLGDGDVAGVIAVSQAGSRRRHLHGLGRRAGGRAGGGGAALHRRPDAGPADVRGRGAGHPRARDGRDRPEARSTASTRWRAATSCSPRPA